MTAPTGDRSRPVDYVIAEYEAANGAYLQYDWFRWQAGSLLIAGAFVFLGLLSATSETSRTAAVGAIVVTGVMSVWILYAQHYRTLYLFNLDRILELERVMGAEQHLRFNSQMGTRKVYPRIGPRGHNLDLVVYAIITAAGPGLALVGGWFSGWSLVSITVTVIVAVWVVNQDRRARRGLDAGSTPIGLASWNSRRMSAWPVHNV